MQQLQDGKEEKATAASHVTLARESRTMDSVALWVRGTEQRGTGLEEQITVC